MDSSSSFLLGSSAFGYPVQYVSVIVAVIACGAVYRWRRRDLPGPMPWPIFGTALEHILNQNRMHDWLLTYFEKGSTISAPMPLGSWYYYTVDPTNIEYILKTNFSNFPKGETFHYRMEELLGDGIFNSDGDTWRAQRKTAAAEFSLRSLRNFSADIFQEKGRKLAGLVSQIAYDGNSVDMQVISQLRVKLNCMVLVLLETPPVTKNLWQYPIMIWPTESLDYLCCMYNS